MGSITSQWIVDRLITTPKNEFESGMNSAYISILKEIAPKSIPTQLSTEVLKLKTTMGDTDFNKLTQTGIDELLSAYNAKQKLQFVKLLKDFIGCGLVEAKSIADKFW
jgi:ribosomal protein L7/L12